MDALSSLIFQIHSVPLKLQPLVVSQYWQKTKSHFDNGTSLQLEACTWRLEKNTHYVVGYLDYVQEGMRSELSKLIGKRLKQIDIANSMMDARLQFEGGYLLKTFTCWREVDQWKICAKNETLFSASIDLPPKGGA